MAVLLKKNYRAEVTSVEETIRERLRRSEFGSFIAVVPTKRKLRDLQREFLYHVPGEIAPSFFLFTLETLTAQLYYLSSALKFVVSGPTQAVIMNNAIRAVAKQLRYFRLRGKTAWLPKGTFQKIIDVINYLKEKGAYPTALYSEIESAEPPEKTKLGDILMIYEEYEKQLGERFIDAAGMFKHVNLEWDNSEMPSAFRRHFPNVNAIFVSGFDEFSNPELTLVEHLAGLDNIGTVIEFDYSQGNDELFGHLRDNYEKFQSIGFTKVSAPEETDGSFKHHITQHLFHSTSLSVFQSSTERVTLLAATNHEAEVESIARVIKQMIHRNPGRDLSKICVAMYQPQLYTALIREVFGRYGVPANITDRYALDQAPMVVSVLALLEVQQRNFQLRDIMRAMSNSYFRFTTSTGEINSSNLYEIATRLKITGGYATWNKRIDQRLLVLRDEIVSASDDVEEATLVKEERSLRQARADLEYLSGVLKPFNNQMTSREFKERLVSLMERLHMLTSLISIHTMTGEQELLEKETRSYQQFMSFLDTFLDILALHGSENVREPLNYYLDQLRTTLSQSRYNIRQRYGYGVLVTSFEETRGLNFETMFVCGLVDGEFPPMYQPEILLSATRRERIERYHLTEHRYLFYQAMTNFTEHLYLSYPKKDGDLELVPSSFIDALLNVAEIEDWRHAMPGEIADSIYSEDELLLRYGRHLSLTNEPFEIPEIKKGIHQALESIHHAINVERSRISGTEKPEYNGRIFASLDADGRSALERLRQHVFSVTQLESYGKCSFQYFAGKVLRLNIVSELEEGLSPIERGGLLHEILFEFYTDRREKRKGALASCSEDQFHEALEDLRSLARKKIDNYAIPDILWEVDKELILGTANRKGVLQEFLEKERERDLTVQPGYFEVAFGSKVGPRNRTDERLRHEDAITAGNVLLRGKVDRIDLGDRSFTIIDYKTGTIVARRKEIDLGMSLQLPIYLYAVERILAEKEQRTIAGAAGVYYMLKSPVKEQLGIGSRDHLNEAFKARASNQLLESDAVLQSIIEQAVRYVNEYVDGIARGEFPVKPQLPEKTCERCDFRTICRIQVRIGGTQEKQA